MIDQGAEWVMEPAKAWKWAMGEVEAAKNGSHRPVKNIHNAADMIWARFYTNGMWSPAAEKVYLMLREATGMAQDEYEKAQPSME